MITEYYININFVVFCGCLHNYAQTRFSALFCTFDVNTCHTTKSEGKTAEINWNLNERLALLSYESIADRWRKET